MAGSRPPALLRPVRGRNSSRWVRRPDSRVSCRACRVPAPVPCRYPLMLRRPVPFAGARRDVVMTPKDKRPRDPAGKGMRPRPEPDGTAIDVSGHSTDRVFRTEVPYKIAKPRLCHAEKYVSYIYIYTLPDSGPLPSVSAKTRKYSAKALPSVTLGKGHSAANIPAKTSLPSVFTRALGKGFAECHGRHSAKKNGRDGV
jgi:hypothetical protein